MNTSVKEIRYYVMHDPRPLKFLFRNPNEDKKRLSGIIGRMIPYRIGIEFELFGTLTNLVPKSCDQPKTYLQNKFKLRDYSEDLYRNWNSQKEERGELNEIRISIDGVKQLNSLWNVLFALRENCKIPAEKGGIHIHIDFTEPVTFNENAKTIAKKYFNKKETLDKVINIFGGYKGNYNERGCEIGIKHYWINISTKNTIEFRIGSLNFDYKTIIRWIVELSKLVTEVKIQVPIVDSVKKLKLNSDPEFDEHLVMLNNLIAQVSEDHDRYRVYRDYASQGTTANNSTTDSSNFIWYNLPVNNSNYI